MGGGPFYAALGGSRICDTDRVDQSGADDANVVDWAKADIIIVAVNINSGGKDTEAAQYKLRWRDETDNPGGAFIDLDTTGECKFGDATALSHGTGIPVGTRRCDSQGNDTWQSGEEVEGTKLSDSIDLPDEYETELHFAVSLADGDDGHQYTFELYDDTLGAVTGILGAQITLVSGITQQNVGDHDMFIGGAVAVIVTFVEDVGGGSIPSVGTLGRTISRSMGQASMAIVGTLNRKISKAIGGGSVTIIGTLTSALYLLQSVGGAAMAIVGDLATQFIAGVEKVYKFLSNILREVLK